MLFLKERSLPRILSLGLCTLVILVTAARGGGSSKNSALNQPFSEVTLSPSVEWVKGKNVDSIAPWMDRNNNTKVFITGKRSNDLNVFDINGGNTESSVSHRGINGVIVFEDEVFISTRGRAGDITVFDAATLNEQRTFAGGELGSGEHDLDICSAVNTDGVDVAWVTDDSGKVLAFDAANGFKLYEIDTGITNGLEEVEVIEHNNQCTLIIANENVQGGYGFQVWHADAASAVKIADFGQGLYSEGDSEGIQAFLAEDGSGYLVSSEQRSTLTRFRVYHFNLTGTDFTYLGYFLLSDVENTDGVSGFQWPVQNHPEGMFLAIDDDSRGVGIGLDELWNATGLSLDADGGRSNEVKGYLDSIDLGRKSPLMHRD